MTVVIGADAGGTRTRAVIARDGKVLADCIVGPGALRPGGIESSARVIIGVVRDALREAALPRADRLVVGAAGAGREPVRMALEEAIQRRGLAERVRATTDLAIALEAGFPGTAGIVLLAGTGSVAVGRLPDGTVLRAGGRGWRIDDEGGGYWIGREAIAAIGRAVDGREEVTELQDRIEEATGVTAATTLFDWATAARPSEIASLAPLVCAASAEGDKVATAILDRAAVALADLAFALAKRFPKGKPVPIALGGGLWQDEPFRTRVEARLSTCPAFTTAPVVVEPVLGALAMARES